MSAPVLDAPDAGLVHLGLVYDDVDDLVRRALPEIRSVLDAGGDVSLTVDRSGVRAFREALGPDVERVRFPSPSGERRSTAPELLRRLRGETPPGRRRLVLGQYTATTPSTWDCAYAEDAVNLVLADLPLTVMCACARTGGAEHLALTARSHPELLGADGRVANPDHRPPVATCPAPMAPWGPPRVSTTVADADDLAELRHRVAAAADECGLTGDAARAAVLGVHEAVLLAGGAPLGPEPGPPGGKQDVRVHVAGGALVAEVLADPRAADPGQDARRACLAAFADRWLVHDDPDGRVVRVLHALEPLVGVSP